MRLSELEAQFYRHSIEPASAWHGRTEKLPSMQLLIDQTQLPLMEFRYTRWGGFPTTTWCQVESFAEADRVMFICPVEGCYHRVAVDFVGRRTPDSDCVHNSEGNPVRWTASGTCIEDLTLSPSIAIIGGCAWHGFVENGGIRTC